MVHSAEQPVIQYNQKHNGGSIQNFQKNGFKAHNYNQPQLFSIELSDRDFTITPLESPFPLFMYIIQNKGESVNINAVKETKKRCLRPSRRHRKFIMGEGTFIPRWPVLFRRNQRIPLPPGGAAPPDWPLRWRASVSVGFPDSPWGCWHRSQWRRCSRPGSFP